MSEFQAGVIRNKLRRYLEHSNEQIKVYAQVIQELKSIQGLRIVEANNSMTTSFLNKILIQFDQISATDLTKLNLRLEVLTMII